MIADVIEVSSVFRSPENEFKFVVICGGKEVINHKVQYPSKIENKSKAGAKIYLEAHRGYFYLCQKNSRKYWIDQYRRRKENSVHLRSLCR